MLQARGASSTGAGSARASRVLSGIVLAPASANSVISGMKDRRFIVEFDLMI